MLLSYRANPICLHESWHKNPSKIRIKPFLSHFFPPPLREAFIFKNILCDQCRDRQAFVLRQFFHLAINIFIHINTITSFILFLICSHVRRLLSPIYIDPVSRNADRILRKTQYFSLRNPSIFSNVCRAEAKHRFCLFSLLILTDNALNRRLEQDNVLSRGTTKIKALSKNEIMVS